MSQIVRNENYDYVVLDAQGRFIGFLDHRGEPFSIAQAAYDGTGNVTGIKNQDGSIASLSGIVGALVAGNNLSDVASQSTAKTNLGLGNVNNTSDANKPISDLTQLALNAKVSTSRQVAGLPLSADVVLKTVGGVPLGGAGNIDISGAAGVATVAYSNTIPLDSVTGKRSAEELVNSNRTLSLGSGPVPDGYYEIIFRFNGTNVLTIPSTWKRLPGHSAPNQADTKRSFLFFMYDYGGEVNYGVIPKDDLDLTAPTFGTPHLENGAKAVVVQPMSEAIGTQIPLPGDITATNAGGRTISTVTKSGSDLLITFSSNFDWQSNPSIATAASKVNDLTGNLAGPSGTLAVTNNIPMPVPGQPTALNHGTLAPTSVVLTWTAPAVNSTQGTVADYVVEWALAGSGSWNVFADGTSSSTGATVTGLTAGTSYDFRVKATNAPGAGAYSATHTVSTTSSATLTGALTTSADKTISAFDDYVLPGRLGGATGYNDGKDGINLISAMSRTNFTGLFANFDGQITLTYPVGGLDGGGGTGSADQALVGASDGTGSSHIDWTLPATAGVMHTAYLYFRPWFEDGTAINTKTMLKIAASLSDASAAPLAYTFLNEAQFGPGNHYELKITYQPAATGTLNLRMSCGDADGISIAGGTAISVHGLVYSATGA